MPGFSPVFLRHPYKTGNHSRIYTFQMPPCGFTLLRSYCYPYESWVANTAMECIVRFTTSAIKSLKPKAERYEKWETGRKGFGIRVAPGGRKTWVYLFRFEGKPRRMSLGTFPQMGLSAAHTRHAKAAEKLERGADPGAELVCQRKAEREAETVADLANEYIERYARKEKRSGDQDERTIARDIIPALGTRKAKDVSRRDIIQMLDKIEGRGSPVMRNRTASLISKLFVFGLDRGIVTASPAVGIKALQATPRHILGRLVKLTCSFLCTISE